MRSLLFGAGCLLTLLPLVCSAHATGQSFEKEVDEYMSDIGYDVPLTQGEETLLDFALFDAKGELASFTEIDVSVFSGSTIMTEKSIEKSEFGKAFMTLIPIHAGHWTLTVEYSNNGTAVASVAFDIDIQTGTQGSSKVAMAAVSAFLIACMGTGIFFLLRLTRS